MQERELKAQQTLKFSEGEPVKLGNFDELKEQPRKRPPSNKLNQWYEDKIDCLSQFVFRHFQVIQLSSKYQLVWNFLNYLVIFYAFLSNLFTIFIVSVLQQQLATTQPFHRASKYSMAIILIIDMLFVRWRVQGLDQLQRKRNSKQIFKTYIAYYFLIDLAVIIVVIMDVTKFRFGYWKIILYLKAFQYQNIKEEIDVQINGHIVLQLIFKTLRLLFFISFWSFFFASIYVTIELQYIEEKGFEYENGLLWMTASPALKFVNIYEKFEWYVWFEYALFFVLQMVRGAGLGVPAPRCSLSVLWYNIANVTMTVLFWYFTDKVIWVVTKYMQKNKLAQNLINLKQMKKIRIISQQDYLKYGRFFKISFNLDSIEAVNHQNQLQSMLPQFLLKKFNEGLKQHFPLRFSFLNDVIRGSPFESRCKKLLTQIIHSKVLHQSQVLFRRNKVGLERLYLSEFSHFIISNGPIEYAERLEQWSFIGVRQFFFERRSLFDVIGSRIASVQYIDKPQFLQILRRFPCIYQSFCHKMDLTKIERMTTELLEIKCLHCSGYHLSQDCKIRSPNKNLILLRMAVRRENELACTDQNLRQFRIRKTNKAVKFKHLKHNSLEMIGSLKNRTLTCLEYNLTTLKFSKRQEQSQMKTIQIPFLMNAQTLSVIPLQN